MRRLDYTSGRAYMLTSHRSATATTVPKWSSDNHTTPTAIPPPATNSQSTFRLCHQLIIPIRLSHRSLPMRLTPATLTPRRMRPRRTARRSRNRQISHSQVGHTLGAYIVVHTAARMEDKTQLRVAQLPIRVLSLMRFLLSLARAAVLSLRWGS